MIMAMDHPPFIDDFSHLSHGQSDWGFPPWDFPCLRSGSPPDPEAPEAYCLMVM